MNVVIEDSNNKKYQPYASCTESEAIFIMSTVNKINSKYDTQLIVYEDIKTRLFEDKDYEMSHGILDGYINKYNSDLKEGEDHLIRWPRD